MEALVKRILAEYGMHDVDLLIPGKGYRNHSFPARLSDGSIVNLMLYKREPGMLQRVQRANAVANFAFAHGLPARHTHDERIVQLTTARGVGYASLYDYAPGVTIPWEAYTMKHIKQLGKYLSDLHAVLASYDADDLPSVAEEYRQINVRMRRYFASDGVKNALRQKLFIELNPDLFDSFDWLLSICEHLPDQQALHMDFVRSNLLFRDSEAGPVISGILDFEKTAFGSPLFDIARTLAFLLVDCKYKTTDKVRKYFLVSGYQKRGNAQLRDIMVIIGSKNARVLEELLGLFLVYDLYKFLRHNPYECLDQNEHFVRTHKLLLELRMLSQTN
jgi:Ser/Thr protein kinase RdoA (MazF antagonist)